MAITKRDPKTGEFIPLTDREIKRELMLSLGLDPKDPDDQKAYRRQYDIIRKKVRQYNELLQPKMPLKANEVFLRIKRRELAGKDLTPQQENILSFSGGNIGTYKKRLSNDPEYARTQSILYWENEFSQFLAKNSKWTQRYNTWLNTEIGRRYIDKSTGEILATKPAGKIGLDFEVEIITRKQTVTGEEVKNKLYALASDLHTYQKNVYEKSKASFNYNRRAVGTP